MNDAEIYSGGFLRLSSGWFAGLPLGARLGGGGGLGLSRCAVGGLGGGLGALAVSAKARKSAGAWSSSTNSTFSRFIVGFLQHGGCHSASALASPLKLCRLNRLSAPAGAGSGGVRLSYGTVPSRVDSPKLRT